LKQRIIIGFLGGPEGVLKRWLYVYHKILYYLKCNILRTLKQRIIIGFLGGPFGGSQKVGCIFYYKNNKLSENPYFFTYIHLGKKIIKKREKTIFCKGVLQGFSKSWFYVLS
jgi:hypothetical protein